MNIDVIYSKMFCVDRLNTLGRVYYTKLRKISEMLCGAIFYIAYSILFIFRMLNKRIFMLDLKG